MGGTAQRCTISSPQGIAKPPSHALCKQSETEYIILPSRTVVLVRDALVTRSLSLGFPVFRNGLFDGGDMHQRIGKVFAILPTIDKTNNPATIYNKLTWH